MAIKNAGAGLRIHAILIALNEEDFIREALRPLYPCCSGISVITQYDRDYYRSPVEPDKTAGLVLSYPDPEGKISLVVRRFTDETVSRNHEMGAWTSGACDGVLPHAWRLEEVERQYGVPDYFLVVDADEIYDVDTLPRIIEYLARKRPRGMRVSAYEYGRTWNHRVPPATYMHRQFGFVRAGVRFESRREVSFNEHRLAKVLAAFGLPRRLASRLYGFIDCPIEIGVFHHAAYLRRNRAQLIAKIEKHSHKREHVTVDWVDRMLGQPYDYVPTSELPGNIRDGHWPVEFFDAVPLEAHRSVARAPAS